MRSSFGLLVGPVILSCLTIRHQSDQIHTNFWYVENMSKNFRSSTKDSSYTLEDDIDLCSVAIFNFHYHLLWTINSNVSVSQNPLISDLNSLLSGWERKSNNNGLRKLQLLQTPLGHFPQKASHHKNNRNTVIQFCHVFYFILPLHWRAFKVQQKAELMLIWELIAFSHML